MPLLMREPQRSGQSNASSGHYQDETSDRSDSVKWSYRSPSFWSRSSSLARYSQEQSRDRYSPEENPGYLSSEEGLASTACSVSDLDIPYPKFEILQYETPSIRAATPHEFAVYFPSTRKMSIRHDDTTDDGNMNLRVETSVPTPYGGKVELTLFHLRMYDLKFREFSLRRYCRESGKEVCHSSRKPRKPSVLTRPGLQRSMSSALSTLRSKSEPKTSTLGDLNRQDSAYDPKSDDGDEADASPLDSSSSSVLAKPSDTIKLEFANYAQLYIRQRGAKTSKRYDFEYWGSRYSWKRTSSQYGSFTEVSYHLTDAVTRDAVAHMVLIPLSPSEAEQEEAKGGWVPPCWLWISNARLLQKPADIAEAVIASGLIALVDDSIERKWHSEAHSQFSRLMSNQRLTAKGGQNRTKRLIDEVFHPKWSTARATPIRQSSDIPPISNKASS